jgi:tetratricopeptide (TPR) repeat protein
MLTVSLRKFSQVLSSRSSAALLAALLLAAACAQARAQAIGANRGDIGATGGTQVIQGHIISPLGKLPETRIRVTLNGTNSTPRMATADDDGNFTFSGIEGGPYDLVIDAGKEYETAHESVYVDAGKPISNVPIYLRPKPEANPALAGVPKAALDSYMKAQDFSHKGDTKKAIEQLNAAVTQHPQFGLAYKELGVQYLKTGQLDKAIEAFQSALKLMPDDPYVQLDYGIALAQKRDYAGAETQLRAALSKVKNAGSGHMYLGITLIGLKRNDEAEGELLEAVKLGSEQLGLAHKFLGGIYWGKGDSKRAADELELYVKLTPKAADAERIRQTIKDLRAKK